MQLIFATCLTLASLAVLFTPSSVPVPAARMAQSELCRASWCPGSPYVTPVPGSESCISWTEFTCQLYSGGCEPTQLACQMAMHAKVKNNSTDNCGCTNLSAYPDGDQSFMYGDKTPKQFSGQNSTATFDTTIEVGCGWTNCSGTPFPPNDLTIFVRCGDSSGPNYSSGEIGKAYGRVICSDC